MNKWDTRFIEIAKLIGTWSSCCRRAIGCVTVKDKRIMTTGYNGASSGIISCKEKNFCMRDKLDIPSGTRAELCCAVHAEQNAICQAALMGISLKGTTLYCTHKPCSICFKMIINAGIKRVVYVHDYPDDFSDSLIMESGLQVEKFEA